MYIFTGNNLTVAKLNMDGLDGLDGCGLVLALAFRASEPSLADGTVGNVAGLHRLLRRQQLKLWI